MVRHFSCFISAVAFTVLEESSIKDYVNETYTLERQCFWTCQWIKKKLWFFRRDFTIIIFTHRGIETKFFAWLGHSNAFPLKEGYVKNQTQNLHIYPLL